MCEQITNILKTCDNNNLGGCKKIYFVPLEQFDILSYASGSTTITDVDIAIQAYEVQVPNNTILYSVDLNNNDLGFTEYTHSVSFKIPKRNAITAFKLKAYIEAQNDLVVIVKTLNDTYQVLGKDNGLNVVSASGGSGIVKLDGSNYEITLEGIEEEMEYEILSSVIEAFIN